MGMIIGPTPWWQANLIATLPVGGTLPDNSRIFCKAGGTAWIVAPFSTEIVTVWGNVSCCGFIDNAPAGISDHGQITDTNWPTLNACMISRGFNPSDWFVPNLSQLQSGYACRFFWDTTTCSGSSSGYWSSTEQNDCCANLLGFCNTFPRIFIKNSAVIPVRAFRCVTY